MVYFIYIMVSYPTLLIKCLSWRNNYYPLFTFTINSVQQSVVVEDPCHVGYGAVHPSITSGLYLFILERVSGVDNVFFLVEPTRENCTWGTLFCKFFAQYISSVFKCVTFTVFYSFSVWYRAKNDEKCTLLHSLYFLTILSCDHWTPHWNCIL